MAVSSIGSHGQHPRYEAPSSPPQKPPPPHGKEKTSAPPKKHIEHKVDIKA